MADKPISLSKFRKTRARDDKRTKANQNAVKFGRTKADRLRDESEAARIKTLWKNHERDENQT